MKAGALERLNSLVRSCVSSGAPRQVLMLRIDCLPVSLSRPHHLRLADNALKPLLHAARAELFHLPGPRWVVVWRGDAEDALLEAVDTLDHLLQGSGIPLQDLAVIYELPDQANLLLEALGGDGPVMPEPEFEPGLPPLDPALLTLLEASLAQADVTRFARRRSVWQIDRDGPVLAWEERTLSVRELADGLVPGHDLTAEPWLFRRLSRTLDRRMLALLASPGELREAGPFAIELNVASLTSTEFLRFDAHLPLSLRGNVTVSLPPTDVIADPRAFAFASGFVRSLEYRLLLRDASPDLLAVLAPAAPEFDLLQLPWDDTLPKRINGLSAFGRPEQMVLTGCNTHLAIAWGRSAGLHYFSGPMADRVGLGEPAAAA